jgi:hypothetical protein
MVPVELSVEPDVFHPPAVEDAVDHDRHPLDVGLTARAARPIKDDWPDVVFSQLLFDRPQQLLAPVTGSSAAFTPWSWKTCFDVSIPIRIMWSMDGLLP